MKAPDKTRNPAEDWLKWLAIATMFIDHLRYISPTLELLYYPGRISYPIFAILCGFNMWCRTSNGGKYLSRVIWLAAAVLTAQLVTNDHLPVNPVFTLAFGLMVTLALKRKNGIYIVSSMTIIAAYLILVPTEPAIVAYGLPGILLVVAGGVVGWSIGKPTGIRIASVLLSAGMAALINPELAAMVIATLSGLLTVWVLTGKTSFPPCPMPVGYWLYLAFPLSLVPAVLARVFGW